MGFSFEIVDVDSGSKMTICLTGDSVQIRRPNKGMSKKLQKLALSILDEDLLGSEEAEKASEFIAQSNNMVVLIGEERCG